MAGKALAIASQRLCRGKIFRLMLDLPQAKLILALAATQKLHHKCSLDYVGGKCGTRIRESDLEPQ